MRARSHLLLCVILGHVLRGGEARVKSGKIEFSPRTIVVWVGS